MTTPKKTSFSNCRGGKELSKMTDLSKLYKKVEKLSKRIFHGEKNQSTFVPTAQHQHNSTQSTSSGSNDPHMPHQPVMINPPYPVHPGFGTGFPQYPYPVQQHQTPQYPPSYGWALNSAAAAAADTSSSQQTPSSLGALSLDVGVGNETAGGGFDHLPVYHEEEHNEPPNYLRPDEREITEKRKDQSAKLEQVKQRVMDEVGSMNYIFNDVTELDKYYDQKYPYMLVKDDAITTEELEEQVRKLEEKLRRLAKNGAGLPPPRPPPPRSQSQESSTGPWICGRCSKTNAVDEYRCGKCNLPSRRFDPKEIEFCGCEYCSSAA